MFVPFTQEQFFAAFAEYNLATWPAQLILIAIASLAVFFATVPPRRTTLLPAALLAALWLWSGIYHGLFFQRISPFAWIFAALFIAEGVALVVANRRHSLELQADSSFAGWMGWIIAAYSVMGYPISSEIAGHYYPNTPTFGVPCPLAMLTLGMLLWNTRRTPWYVLAVPAIWAVMATLAALTMGARENFALTLAALIVLLLRSQPRTTRTPTHHSPLHQHG